MSSARSSRVSRATLAAVAATLVVVGAAFAQSSSDTRPTAASSIARTDPSADDLERRMLEVASSLRCPVCQNLSVADSTSEMARDMRALILAELKRGKSPEEIRAYFVEKYGQWILLSPTARGFGLLVWVLPGLAAVVGLGGAVWTVRRWSRRTTTGHAEPLDEAYRARLHTLIAADTLPADLSAEEARTVEALRELEFDYRAGKLSTDDYEQLRAVYEARAAEAEQDAAKARAERRLREMEAEDEPLESPRAQRHGWRLAAGGVSLLAFGLVLGLLLARAVEPRGDGSITGGQLTGTGTGRAVVSRDIGVLLAEGQHAMETGDYRRAADMFRRALEVDQTEPTALAHLGLILVRAGHNEQALRSFDRALEKDPMSAPALWGRGLVLYQAMGRPAEALRAWQTLLTLKISEEDRKQVTSLMAEARKRLDGARAPAVKPARGTDR